MKKKFDAVKYQQEKRLEYSSEFNENSESFVKELQEKYGKLIKPKQKSPSKNTNEKADEN